MRNIARMFAVLLFVASGVVGSVYAESINGSIQGDADCTLDLNLNYTGGNLNMNFTVGSMSPATWNISLFVFDIFVPIISTQLPSIDPPIAVPISLPLPQLGVMGVLTTLTTSAGGIICSDWATVNTPDGNGVVDNISARSKSGKVQITWNHIDAASYNVYRSVSGENYMLLGNTTSTYSTYLDTDVTNGTEYYYKVRGVYAHGIETADSNEVRATPTEGRRRRR